MSGWNGCCCWTTDGWKSGSNRKVDVDEKGKTNKVGEIKNKSRREEINFYFFHDTNLKVSHKKCIWRVRWEFHSERATVSFSSTSVNKWNEHDGREGGRLKGDEVGIGELQKSELWPDDNMTFLQFVANSIFSLSVHRWRYSYSSAWWCGLTIQKDFLIFCFSPTFSISPHHIQRAALFSSSV